MGPRNGTKNYIEHVTKTAQVCRWPSLAYTWPPTLQGNTGGLEVLVMAINLSGPNSDSYKSRRFCSNWVDTAG